MNTQPTRYASFTEFYPYYLSEHANRTSRRLHFAGSSLALGFVLNTAASGDPWWLAAALLAGYGFAWIGHFVFEKNRPATFRHPVYSLMGDWKMWWQMLTGRLPL